MDVAFRRYVEQCPDSVLVTDTGGRIVYANPAFERMTGYSAAELVGGTPALLKSGLHEADFYRELWSALLAGQEFRALFANRRKNGEPYYEDKIIRPLFDDAGRATHFVSYGRDATERAREFEKLTHAATHDSLTDLPNLSLFLDRLDQALRHAARREEQLTLAILDIDRFRDTNNTRGHLAGDAVLRAVAARTRACVRDADTVARIGGDEIAVILVGAGDADAAGVLTKIVAANAAPVTFDGRELRATVSVGASGYPHDASDEHALRKQADAAMYAAKGAGGNRYAFYRR
ncbi:MAG TPA: diguanylate cyclase [Burkholderiales bacterium]|nr:diguanylate cyclase [Burkholderiales bacterium]